MGWESMLRFISLSFFCLVILTNTATAANTSGPQSLNSQEVPVAEIVEEIVGRILTSDSSLSGTNQIQFVIQDSLLRATEVRVMKEAGKIHVSFTTSSDESLHQISANGWTIQAKLQERLNFPVFVTLQTVEQDSGPDLPRSP